MMDLIRRADLLLLVVDLQGPTLEQIEDSLDFLAAQGIAPNCARTRARSAAVTASASPCGGQQVR